MFVSERDAPFSFPAISSMFIITAAIKTNSKPREGRF